MVVIAEVNAISCSEYAIGVRKARLVNDKCPMSVIFEEQ
ncbi:hypothetical protein CLV93_11727 [Prolixibacter denitrificans]|uniref:Uncharacterized protein n=1 Tax=Prolixibacter denitrificans TaxID=1541063 RepID=A0A2P8C5Y9_9BACT|nr:hypothetical protein CLV93_11727 [Prolixibacter denitrificans]